VSIQEVEAEYAEGRGRKGEKEGGYLFADFDEIERRPFI